MPRRSAAVVTSTVETTVVEDTPVSDATQNGTEVASSTPASDTAAPIRVNLGDGAVIKHVLDEHAARVSQYTLSAPRCAVAGCV